MTSKSTRTFPTKTKMANVETRDRVYKILTEAEWERFQKTGRFNGSSDDTRDGFIHLSTKEQVDGVIETYFSGKSPLYVAEFSSSSFLDCLRWEPSSSGKIYPHLYDFELHVSDLTGFTQI